MNLEESTYLIKFDQQEIYDLLFCIHHDLMGSIERHYNNLQQNEDDESVFFEQRKNYLKFLKSFASMLDRIDIYDDYIEQYKKLFETKRAERKGR